MGLISKVLSYTRIADRFGAKVSDVKHDPGGGANETGEHFQAANQDAVPLPGDYLLTVSVQRTGGEVVVGFIDPNQEQTAEPGESRTYARDSSGAEVVQLYLKKDGSAELVNDSGSVSLSPDGRILAANGGGFIDLTAGGTVNINGATIDPAGNITTPTTVSAAQVTAPSVVAGGKELAGHKHIGSPSAPSGPVSDTGVNI